MGVVGLIASLQKAHIIIYNGTSEEKITCTFNPSEYTIKDSASYKENPNVASGTSSTTFTGVNTSTFSTSLFFDSMKGELPAGGGVLASLAAMDETIAPVTSITKKLIKAVNVEGELHAPPKVAFVWGDLEFKGVVTDLSQTFTMFTPFGKPIRAKVELTIISEEGVNSKVSPLQSPDRTKCKVVTEGMSLWSIAHEEYGDCEKWRVIAKANHLMNPLDIKQGQMLKIPALT